MNTKNNIDQLFAPLRETATDAPMHLWPDIEAAIAPEPKKKKRFLWFGLFGFLLLAASSLVLYDQKAQPSSHLTTQPIEKIPHGDNATAITSLHPQKNKQQAPQKASRYSDRRNKTLNSKKLGTTSRKSTFEPTKILPKQMHKTTIPIKPVAFAPQNPEQKQLAAPSKTTSHQSGSHTPITHLLDLEIALLPQIEIDFPKNYKNLTKPEEKCAGSRVIKVPKSIFIDAYVSPVFSNTFFAARTPEASSYAKLRDSTEGDEVGILLGARIGYIHESGINARAGIAYQQIKNKFQYTVEQDEKMIIQIFRDDNGNIIGRDTTYEFGRRRLNLTNKYSTVDLPISLGYISMKNKVQIGLHVGTSLNLSFRQSGTYLDQESLVTKFSDKKIFEKSIGASFFGSVELQYLLADRWGVFIEPQVRFYPKSLTSKKHPIIQSVTNFNMLTGIKYVF